MKLSRIIFFFFLLLLLFFSSALSSQPLEPTFSSFTLFPSRSLSRLEKRRSSSRRLCISRTNRQPRNVFRRLSTSPLFYRFLFSPSSSHCLRFVPFNARNFAYEPRKTKSLTFCFPLLGKSKLFSTIFSPYSSFPRFIDFHQRFFQRTNNDLCVIAFPAIFPDISPFAMRQIRARNFPEGISIAPVPSFRISTIQQLSLYAINLPFEIIDAKRNLHDLFLPASRLDEWRNVDSRYLRFEAGSDVSKAYR